MSVAQQELENLKIQMEQDGRKILFYFLKNTLETDPDLYYLAPIFTEENPQAFDYLMDGVVL